MSLSQKRVQSAVNYIETQGKDMRRLAPSGYGEYKLMNKCRCVGSNIVPGTEVQYQENRRTEFKVVKF